MFVFPSFFASLSLSDLIASVTQASVLEHREKQQTDKTSLLLQPVEIQLLNRVCCIGCPTKRPSNLTGGVIAWQKESIVFLGNAVCLQGIVKGFHEMKHTAEATATGNDRQIDDTKVVHLIDEPPAFKQLLWNVNQWVELLRSPSLQPQRSMLQTNAQNFQRVVLGLSESMQAIGLWIEVSVL